MRLLMYIGPAVNKRFGRRCDCTISVVLLEDGLLGFKSQRVHCSTYLLASWRPAPLPILISGYSCYTCANPQANAMGMQ